MNLGSVHLELPKVSGIEHLLAPLVNGACRFRDSADTGDETDDRGFLLPVYENDAGEFYPCVWIGKKIDESLIADQTRSVAGYEITIQQIINGIPVAVAANGKMDLRLKPDVTNFQTLEIVAVINQTNIFWQIFAIDIEE